MAGTQQPEASRSIFDCYKDLLDIDFFKPLDRFEHLNDTDFFDSLDKPVPRVDWNDDMLKLREGVELTVLDIKGINTLGKNVLPCLMTGVSEQVLGAIIVLAWNLISPTTKTRIYPQVDPTATATSKSYSELSAEVHEPTGLTCNLIWPHDPIKCASAISYVCASLLRLFTKSSESYQKSWFRINEMFQAFYGYAFPISGLNPSSTCLSTVEIWFRRDDSFKYGLAGFLYVHNNLESDKRLRKLLFEQHLAYTGMHAFDLFSRVKAALDLSTEELVSVLKNRMTVKALETISLILEEFVQNPAENRKKQTWKYARLYGSDFFSRIQTKNCIQLVSTLAYLVKLLGLEDAENVLGIVQLQNLPPARKDEHRMHAEQIISCFKKEKKLLVTQ